MIDCLQQEVERLGASYPIMNEVTLGIDVGTSSCGIALIWGDRIAFLGVRCFRSATDAYTGLAKSSIRRQKRGRRLRLKRHRQRRQQLRGLLEAAGLLPAAGKLPPLDPYQIRAEGLERRLIPFEFGVALAHMAKRRGYVPRRELKHAAEASRLAIGPIAAQAARNEMHAESYRTAGEMLARDPAFAQRKRNRAGNYRAALSRRMIENETATFFEAQRQFGNPAATEDFQQAFRDIAFQQTRAEPRARCVGPCPYLPSDQRGARHAPTIERFRFLDALTKLKIADGGTIRRLQPVEVARAAERFGRTLRITRLDLRRWLALDERIRFIDGRPEEADIVSSMGAAFGTVTLRGVLGRGWWRDLGERPGLLDRIAEQVAFQRSYPDLAAALEELGLAAPVIEAILEAFSDGEFEHFRGTAALSCEAAGRMLPFLERGKDMQEAAAKAGLDPRAPQQQILHRLQRPSVRRAVMETMKQVRAILREWQIRPGRIHVEVSRELALGPSQRSALQEYRRKRRTARAAARTALAELADGKPHGRVSNAMVERYLLWQEQSGRCIYSGEEIPVAELFDGSRVQVDHILPLSRSGDHSRTNTVICRAYANQRKGNRTPFEWLGHDQKSWHEFRRRVRWLPISPRKQKFLLARQFASREAATLNRNLHDTGQAAQCVLAALGVMYPEAERVRRVVSRPSQLTAVLRRAWGFSKDREDLRHHALDALITALASDRIFVQLTEARRNMGSAVDVAFHPPWKNFGLDVMTALSNVAVSRSEQHRGRGSAHGHTVRRQRIQPDGSRVLYERRPLARLRKTDLARIPDPNVNWRLIRALEGWFARGAPLDEPPTSPQGDPIRRVRLKLTGAAGVPRDGLPIRGGIAAYGDLVRIDLFERRGRYVMVPVYAVHVATERDPPALAVVRDKPRDAWRPIGPEDHFLFSIYRDALIRVKRRNGEVIEGFFRGADIASLRLALADPLMPRTIRRVPISLALNIEKFVVDRLGRRFPVRKEMRTWRGLNKPWPPKSMAVQIDLPAKKETSVPEVQA